MVHFVLEEVFLMAEPAPQSNDNSAPTETSSYDTTDALYKNPVLSHATFPLKAAELNETRQRNPEHSDVQMLIWEMKRPQGKALRADQLQ